MEMTYQQYIDNPLGKKNAVFSQRDMYKTMYNNKFDALLLREAGKINYSLYIDKSKDRYVIHIKVPSETVKDFYYDAVILFYTNDAAAHSSSSLKDYYVKFFSNDPAFVFTYLRVFLKNDLFFEDMKPKTSKLALTKDPKEKNPYEIPGYSKILYFAFLYMKIKNLFNKVIFQTYATDYKAKTLLNFVEHTDIKIAKRQELGEQVAKEKSKERKEEKKKSNSEHVAAINQFNQKRTRVSSAPQKINTTKTTHEVKKTGRVKTTKRVK